MSCSASGSTSRCNPSDSCPHVQTQRYQDLGAHSFDERGPDGRGSLDVQYVLAHWVREAGVLNLEEAVARLTARPADACGLIDRGRLTPGLAADVVIFDLERVGGGQLQTVHDLPAHQPRLIQQARGVQMVIVNGEVVLEEGNPTGAVPGRVVRGE